MAGDAGREVLGGGEGLEDAIPHPDAGEYPQQREKGESR